MLYPGISSVLEAPEVAETAKETVKGKMGALLDEIAVPMISGLLKVPAVVNGIGGETDEKLKDGWVNE